CLGGQPVVETVLRRVNRAGTVDTVVLATSTLDQDDALSALAGDLGFECVRGSESDVLARVYRAAQTFDADVVVRVCADNPLVAPEEIDRVVKRHVQAGGDYTFNHIPAKGNGYPDGFGAEVLNMSV
ncbi:MAG: cytidylyltransferase domain-containing protein, partial [Halobacteriaceae archaeon]